LTSPSGSCPFPCFASLKIKPSTSSHDQTLFLPSALCLF
jgi:hypothetical protein